MPRSSRFPFPTIASSCVYVTAERRHERVSGGLPPWTWMGLQPLLRGLDALYVNLLAGWELDLETRSSSSALPRPDLL